MFCGIESRRKYTLWGSYPSLRCVISLFQGPGLNGFRTFQVNELTSAASAVIHRYLAVAGANSPSHVPAAAALGVLPWGVPSAVDYDLLAAESEYGAWTLAHGYRINHMAIAVHRLLGPR